MMDIRQTTPQLREAEGDRRADRYERALAAFERVLVDTPNHPVAIAGRADCLYNLGRNTEALQSATSAIKEDPRLALPHVVLAYLLDDQGNSSEAKAHAAIAVAVEPENAAGYSCRGALSTIHGNFVDALPDLKKAVELDPADYLAQHNLAACFQALGDPRAAYRQSLVLWNLRPTAENLVRLIATALGANYLLFAVLLLVPLLRLVVNWPFLLAPHAMLILVYAAAGFVALRRGATRLFAKNVGVALFIAFLSIAILLSSA